MADLALVTKVVSVTHLSRVCTTSLTPLVISARTTGDIGRHIGVCRRCTAVQSTCYAQARSFSPSSTQDCGNVLLHRHSRNYSSTPSPGRMMPFEEYRKLKKALKTRARISGLPMALVGILASSAINVHFNPNMLTPVPEEEIQLVLGMDPIAVAVLCGLGSGIVGYMLGGALFNATWRILARTKGKQLQERDEDFLQRIQKHRSVHFNRFHDDYYGDKIKTLSDYRQWVRQQQEADRGERRRQLETDTQTAS